MSVRLPVRLKLQPHPATGAGAATRVETDIDLHPRGGLLLRYAVEHDGGLRIPAIQPSGPADELWRHTCCEAFITVAGETAYREFNFSPSGQWAVYDFARYRARSDAAPPAGTAPQILVTAMPQRLELAIQVPAALLPAAPPGRQWMLGLSAVTEDGGGLHYWALRHPAVQADFHDRRGFALALSPHFPRPEHP
ncbi:DOMON-like domain-containing protein [Pseudothauera nasutitermitis]|uniref:DOMON-like domain-containing protein n=1 Tax=Pseudothauera nasutitermitis TaxID=2565930 RepID=A0A4S4ASJ1_9RHOO|nr:DOMON-like domain-containing protein [Pseudothauera nasutitermitis]THF62802.1 DOMON-like domain-containing protein [Pseudothauera nasutitermitis]